MHASGAKEVAAWVPPRHVSMTGSFSHLFPFSVLKLKVIRRRRYQQQQQQQLMIIFSKSRAYYLIYHQPLVCLIVELKGPP